MHTHTNSKSAFSIYIVYTLYIQLLRLNLHLIINFDMACTSFCFQGFVALMCRL